MDKEIKYVVCPGHVRSRNDGDIHHISAMTLMRLYKVNQKECVIRHGDKRDWGKDFSKLIALYPRGDGNYEVPK